jgi:ComF family protein
MEAVNRILLRYLQGFASLFFPRSCAACGEVLYRNERILCTKCRIGLPRTGFHLNPENEIARMFWGRIPVVQATSFIYFTKGSPYQQILHELKYRDNCEAGMELGRLFGLELKNSGFARVDLIHPVPLHPDKLRIRGYNQSECIARGMGEILLLPVLTGIIARKADTPSQTRKTRYERWENLRGQFICIDPQTVRQKHILLVDDVITTGATLESCAACLLDTGGNSVSIATLAFARLD